MVWSSSTCTYCESICILLGVPSMPLYEVVVWSKGLLVQLHHQVLEERREPQLHLLVWFLSSLRLWKRFGEEEHKASGERLVQA